MALSLNNQRHIYTYIVIGNSSLLIERQLVSGVGLTWNDAQQGSALQNKLMQEYSFWMLLLSSLFSYMADVFKGAKVTPRDGFEHCVCAHCAMTFIG